MPPKLDECETQRATTLFYDLDDDPIIGDLFLEDDAAAKTSESTAAAKIRPARAGKFSKFIRSAGNLAASMFSRHADNPNTGHASRL